MIEALAQKNANWIDRLFLLSNGVLIIGAILVMIATNDISANLMTFIGSGVVVIGTSGVFAFGVMGERRARKSISESNAKAAAALEKVSEAQIEIERLRLLSAWRRLGKHQNDTFISVLSELPREHRSEIWVQFVDTDPEAVVFQQDIREAIQAAGYTDHYYSGWERAIGLKVSNCTSPTGRVLASAFAAAGIEIRALEGDIEGAPGKGVPQVLVGSRPPPPGTNVNY